MAMESAGVSRIVACPGKVSIQLPSAIFGPSGKRSMKRGYPMRLCHRGAFFYRDCPRAGQRFYSRKPLTGVRVVTKSWARPADLSLSGPIMIRNRSTS